MPLKKPLAPIEELFDKWEAVKQLTQQFENPFSVELGDSSYQHKEYTSIACFALDGLRDDDSKKWTSIDKNLNKETAEEIAAELQQIVAPYQSQYKLVHVVATAIFSVSVAEVDRIQIWGSRAVEL